jgi:probable HAF family extracellular repeat protein
MPGSLVYTQVDANNESDTVLFGVNDSGDVVGAVTDATLQNHSFVAGASFQDIFDVGTGNDDAVGINNSGEIIGFYTDADGNAFAYSAELSNLSGAAAIPNVPVDAFANGIDANGDIVGVLMDGDQFEVVGGVFGTVFNPPDIFFNAVSENGQVVLIVTDSAENILATTTGVGGGPLFNLAAADVGQGVNDAGQVVGLDESDDSSFFRDSDGTVYGINIPGAAETFAEGINDNGEIVGYFVQADGRAHGFTTTVAAVEAVDDVLAVACYCAGTLIATENGDAPVESLKIGDKLLTRSGASRPIKWIGQRGYRGRFIAGNKDVLPICIKAGALADNVPRRDLWISPHHAMLIDGLLIEGRDLVNGMSIVQAAHVDKVSYFHVELETHDVIVAEGALSETYMDEDNRGMFQNAQGYEVLYPDAPALPAQYCAPRVEDGYELEAVRRRIALRAASSAQAESRISVFRRSA